MTGRQPDSGNPTVRDERRALRKRDEGWCSNSHETGNGGYTGECLQPNHARAVILLDEILQEDGRWKYGLPPKNNANFAWMQHMLYHLAPNGVMATVLANGSLSSNTSGEGDIRQALVKAGLVDCIVALPKQLFYNTGIPATIWILRRAGECGTKVPLPNVSENGIGSGTLVPPNKTLFIDASEMGFMKDRVHREFAPEDIEKIEQVYHNWRKDDSYEDIKGFCKSAEREEIEKHSYVLTPGRYVGIPDEEDDGIPFEDKMADLTTTLASQMQKEKVLDKQIKEQLAKIGFELNI